MLLLKVKESITACEKKTSALGVLKREVERRTPKLHNCVNVRVNPGQWSTVSERSCPHDSGDGTVECDGVR